MCLLTQVKHPLFRDIEKRTIDFEDASSWGDNHTDLARSIKIAVDVVGLVN